MFADDPSGVAFTGNIMENVSVILLLGVAIFAIGLLVMIVIRRQAAQASSITDLKNEMETLAERLAALEKRS